MFEDTEFPPLVSMSSSNKQTPLIDHLKSEIKWKRLQSSENTPIELFGHSIFYRGNSLNPSLFSALVALNEYPQRVQKLFITSDLSYFGEYVLTIYDKGLPLKLKLDSSFPYYKNDFAFITPSKFAVPQQVWPLFLEKLWAKKSGGYLKGLNKHISIVLSDLTGAPCDVITTESKNIEEKVLKALSNNFMILASLRQSKPSDLNYLNPRLSFLIKEVKNNQFLIRAPPGCSWSLTDPYDELAWLSFDHLTDNFESVTICKVHDSYKYSFIKSQKSCFEVTLTTFAKTYFQVFHKKRTELRIVVADEKGYLKCKSAIGSRIHIEVETTPGKYFVYVQHADEIVFSVYSAMNSGIEEIEDISYFKQTINPQSLERHKDLKCVEVVQGVQALTLERVGDYDDAFRGGFVFNVFTNNSAFPALVQVLSQVSNMEQSGKNEFLMSPGSFACLYFRQIDLAQPVKYQANVRAKLIKH